MQVGLAQCVNKGMQRDYSMDKASQEFAYENKNIRITTTGSNSFLSVSNEKSTISITLNSALPEGIVILGNAVINDTLVLFGTVENSEYPDYIFKINIEGTDGTVVQLYNGNLNFKTSNPIECVTSYEADDVQKVYWVDGENQPRFINICKQYDSSYTFNFNPVIEGGIEVSINKEYNGGGNFPSGVIQYFITYYNKYEAETQAVYQSPLYYISASDRGGEVDETQTCSFKININTNNDKFEYVRVYSVIRTSLNAEPQVSIVKDVKLNNDNSAQIIDTNTFNTPIAATDVLFLGGSSITASTIEQKDNTLFLGNITELTTDVLTDIKNIANKGTLGFGSKYVKTNNSNNEYYPYAINLDGSSQDIKTFKYLEWYKFGLQVQLNTGEWSSVIDLGDIQNTVKPNQESTIFYNKYGEDVEGIWLPAVYFTPSDALKEVLQSKNVINWRLVMAEHTASTRTIKAQGLVLPTIFNLETRAKKTCYASPLWTLNTALYTNHFENIDRSYHDNGTGVSLVSMSPHFHLPIATNYYNSNNNFEHLENVVNEGGYRVNTSNFYYLKSLKLKISVTRNYGPNATTAVDTFEGELFLTIVNPNANNATLEDSFIIYNNSAPYGQRKKQLNRLSSVLQAVLWEEVKNVTLTNNGISINDISNIDFSTQIFNENEIPSGEELRNNYGVTATNDIAFELPSLARDFVGSINDIYIKNYANNYFLDANVCNFLSPDIDNITDDLQFRIVGSTDIINSISDYTIQVDNNTIGTKTYNYAKYNFNVNKHPLYLENPFTGIKAFPIWPFNNKLYNIHYWHTSNNIVDEHFNIKSKKFANMWVCENIKYGDILNYGKITDNTISENNTVILGTSIYSSNYENLIIPKQFKVGYMGGDSPTEGSPEQPLNETIPLQELSSLILDTNMANIQLVEDITSLGSISIKHNTSKHLVFKLPFKDGYPTILPNYQSVANGANTIYSETIYPVGLTKVSALYFFNLSDSNLTYSDITNNLNISFRANMTIDNYGVTFNLLGGYLRFNNADGYGMTGAGTLDSIDYGNFVIQDHIVRNESFVIYVNAVTKGYYLICTPDVRSLNTSYNYMNIVIKQDESPTFKTVFAIEYNNVGYAVTTTGDTFRQVSLKPYRFTSYGNTSEKLFIGEFYTEYNSNTFFGGDSKKCTFIPISEAYPIDTISGWGLEGDTYYQRWDNVRIYPVADNDVNQNTDAVSIMIETYQNLDGDYRTLRGRTDTTNLTVDNTNNVLNSIYSQSNNYITSAVLDDRFEDYTHPTLYAWSLTKHAASDVDTWANINLTSSAKLDGDKGVLTKIKRWNNKLLAFQEKGIAIINFNNQTTITTTEGIPVEITNSGKVSGHYYISSTQGCKNKWSIIDTPYGVYFIDSYNKSINLLDDSIKSLSTINLFQDWIIENENGYIWNPVDCNGFKSFYDPIQKEVYFVNKDNALCYNELLQQFTSFYDYQKLNTMSLMGGHIYGIKDSNLHLMFEGQDYCNLFDSYKDYYMIYKINKDPFIDKTWTNIEYRADVFKEGNIQDNNSNKIVKETFDTLEVWNEYQYGKTLLNNNKYPNSQVKFRIWRTDIPRDTKHKLDRIRNPWIMLKLNKSKNTDKRLEFHDLLIKYLQ